jgi:aminoglycoside phosphotransferase (APT) family kinase protein
MTTDDDVLALVDRDRLREHLASVVPLGDDLTVEVLSGGRSNLTYLVTSGPHEYVVRRRPLGPVAAGAHDMAREHRVQAALAGSGLPIAPVFGFSDDDAVVGAPFYVMGRVHGSVFHQRADVAGLSPDAARAISEATVEVLRRLHDVDVDAVGLRSLGRPEGFLRRRIGRWLETWRIGAHREHPLVEPLGERLAASVPATTASTLVHGDYRLGNMLIDLEPAPRVAAVLDWEMSTLGDPLTDVAHLMVYWDRTRGRQTHESQTIAEQPGFLTAQELAARYGVLSGRDVSGLDVYLAFEHWRAAIIKEGIHMRTLRGEQPPAGGDDLGDSVGRHLEEAEEILG